MWTIFKGKKVQSQLLPRFCHQCGEIFYIEVSAMLPFQPNGICPACLHVELIMGTSDEKFYLDFLKAEAHVTEYQWKTR